MGDDIRLFNVNSLSHWERDALVNDYKKFNGSEENSIAEVASLLNQKILVLHSELYDEKYYLEVCDFMEFDRTDPLEHYLTKGWRAGLNPSERFDGNDYLERYPWVKTNPLLHYLQSGRFNCQYAFTKNIYVPDEKLITAYLERKRQRKSKKAIYTCVTGDYDDLNEIKMHNHVNFEYDYICFTDNQKMISEKYCGIWEIRHLLFDSLDPTRNNRYHKIKSYKVLPEYDSTIYIDCNINILTSLLFDLVIKNKNDLLFGKHPFRLCAYDEYQGILDYNVDTRELVLAELNLLKQAGFPENYGMPDCSILIRSNRSTELNSMMDEWWEMVRKYSKRDQLAFSYIMWKFGRKMQDFQMSNARVNFKDFMYMEHKKL